MHSRDGDCGIHGLGEGVLEEARICPAKYASVVRVKLDMENLLVVRSCNGDGGREPDLDRCVDGIVASIAYTWGCANETTKMVNCDEVSLRRCEMM